MEFAKYIKVRPEKFGAVIFDTLKEKVYTTNEIGKEILQLIEKKNTENDIYSALEEKFDCNLETVKDETTKFLNELKINQILI
jgi:hypothetical protein